jgi:hypothetical protein
VNVDQLLALLAGERSVDSTGGPRVN